jgi:hypothetical protein
VSVSGKFAVFEILTSRNYAHQGITVYDISRACSKHGGEAKCIQDFDGKDRKDTTRKT